MGPRVVLLRMGEACRAMSQDRALVLPQEGKGRVGSFFPGPAQTQCN